jgi:tetraacyldisaccharide 4'-kinase
MDFAKLRENMLSNAFGRFILAGAAFCYGLGVKFNLFLYEKNFKKAGKINTRVVCIGNITAGGTGKTTAVMLAASGLSKAGVRTAIVSRGYKRSKKAKEVAVLFDQTASDWRETGDEPYMMSQLLAEYKVPVVVGANRCKAAQEALRQFKSQVILLDDGLQHHAIKRDANIVLLDAKDPFGGNALLPLGTLREPAAALKRAALVVITHANLAPAREIEEIKDRVRLINEDIDILEAQHKPAYYFDLINRRRVELGGLSGAVAVFSAIGQPQSFEDTLKGLGLEIKQTWRMSDHSRYTLEQLGNFAALRGGLPLVTTFKDAVKFPPGWQEVIKDNIYLLSVNMEIKDGALGKFMEVLYPGFGKKRQ